MRVRAALALALLLIPSWPAQEAWPAPDATVEKTPAAGAFPAWGAMGNTMVEKDGHAFFAYHDDRYARGIPPVKVYVVHRSPDGAWDAPVHVGYAKDDHAFPALALDADGHLHAVFGGHASAAYPVVHRRSARPLDASEWGAAETVTAVPGSTYSNLALAPDGTLHLVYREGGADDGWLVHRSRAPGQPWSAPATLARTPGWSTYPYDLVAGPDALHVAFAWRPCSGDPVLCPWGRPSHMASRDGGRTWQDGAGRPLALPATRATLAPIAAGDSLLSPHVQLVEAGGALHAFFVRRPGVERTDLWQATLGPAGWAARAVRVGGPVVYNVAALEGAIQLAAPTPGGASVERIASRDGGDTWASFPAWTAPDGVDPHVFLADGRAGGDPPATLRGLAATAPDGAGRHGVLRFELGPLPPAGGLPAPGFCQDCWP